MKIGMLWYDPSKDTLEAKIAKAVNYYGEKYGKSADLVLANPGDVKVKIQVNGVDVEPNRHIMSNHLWIGCRDNLDTSGSRE